MDRKNYELLVEWEQYKCENDRIEGFKSASISHIHQMRKCDSQVSDQLRSYKGHLDQLQRKIENYRHLLQNHYETFNLDSNQIILSIDKEWVNTYRFIFYPSCKFSKRFLG